MATCMYSYTYVLCVYPCICALNLLLGKIKFYLWIVGLRVVFRGNGKLSQTPYSTEYTEIHEACTWRMPKYLARINGIIKTLQPVPSLLIFCLCPFILREKLTVNRNPLGKNLVLTVSHTGSTPVFLAVDYFCLTILYSDASSPYLICVV